MKSKDNLEYYEGEISLKRLGTEMTGMLIITTENFEKNEIPLTVDLQNLEFK